MKEQEVKEVISVEILKRMQDKSAARVIREILFDNNNVIDWNRLVIVLLRICLN